MKGLNKSLFCFHGASIVFPCSHSIPVLICFPRQYLLSGWGKEKKNGRLLFAEACRLTSSNSNWSARSFRCLASQWGAGSRVSKNRGAGHVRSTPTLSAHRRIYGWRTVSPSPAFRTPAHLRAVSLISSTSSFDHVMLKSAYYSS